MDLIQFEAGTKVSDAKVTINGVDYPVTPARYTGNTPLSVYILNLMQSNIAKAVVPTGGTTGQVLVKKSNADNDVEWQTGGGGGASGDTFPIGAISEYAGATAPTNWLICDGSAISRTTYADLFNVIGTRYGTGDGSTTFNLPDLRGRVSVGLDSNDTDFNTLGKTGGEKTHTLTIAEMPKHTVPTGFVTGDLSGNTYGMLSDVNTDGTSTTHEVGGGQPHNIIQPYMVQNYIIKAFQSSGVVANIVQVETDSQDDVYSCDYINNLVEGKIIKESGNTTVDGKIIYYIKFDDGTLIQYGRNTGIENNYRQVNFAVNFTNTPYVVANTEVFDDNYVHLTQIYNIGISGFRCVVRYAGASGGIWSKGSNSFTWLAIGRWK